MAKKEAMNLNQAQKLGYISIGEVNFLTHYFLVPRGYDVGMVYNQALSGFNYALWAPQFYFLTVLTTLRSTYEGTYIADRHIGKISLNLMFSKEVRPYCGGDMSNYWTEYG